MLFKICIFTIFLMYLVILNTLVACEGSYRLLKVNPRFPRSNSKTNNEEFEKFFLKASKSVPRIGRRGSITDNYYPENFNGGIAHQFARYPYGAQPKRTTSKNFGSPFWSDIAQIYEYNPELPNMIENYLSNIEQEQGDDPSVYDLNNMRIKKAKIVPNNEPSNKEIPEYRTQPEKYIRKKMACVQDANQEKSVVFKPSTFKFHLFITEVVDAEIVYQIIKMSESIFICINYKKGLFFNDLSLAMINRYDKQPVSTQLLGDFSETSSKNMAVRISKKLDKNVYVSCNVDNDRLTLPLVEKRLYEEIKNYPDKF